MKKLRSWLFASTSGAGLYWLNTIRARLGRVYIDINRYLITSPASRVITPEVIWKNIFCLITIQFNENILHAISKNSITLILFYPYVCIMIMSIFFEFKILNIEKFYQRGGRKITHNRDSCNAGVPTNRNQINCE